MCTTVGVVQGWDSSGGGSGCPGKWGGCRFQRKGVKGPSWVEVQLWEGGTNEGEGSGAILASG